MEDYQFQFTLPGYSNQDLLALNKLVVKRSKFYRWLIPLIRLFFCSAGIFFLLMGALLIYGSRVGAESNWSLTVLAILLGLLWLYMGVFYYQRRVRGSRRMTMKDIGQISVSFSDEGVEEQSNKGRVNYRYDAFVGAYDYCERWFLFLDKRHAIVLPRAAMTAGEPEAFAAFLEQKLQNEVIHIKSRKKQGRERND